MIEWKRNERPHSSGDLGFLGKVELFSVHWDGVNGSRHPDGPHILTCRLPGIKDDLGHHKSVEDAKAKADRVLSHWLKITGLTTPAEVA